MNLDLNFRDQRVAGWTADNISATSVDLYAALDAPITLNPSDKTEIDTGVSVVSIDSGYVGVIVPAVLNDVTALSLTNPGAVVDDAVDLVIGVSNAAHAINSHGGFNRHPKITIEPGQIIAKLIFVPVATINLVNGSQVSFAATTQISALTTDQVQTLTTDSVQALATTQVTTLTTDQVSALVSTEVSALTTDQVVALATTDVVALSTDQVTAVASTEVAALTTDQVVALSTTQVASLTTDEAPAVQQVAEPAVADVSQVVPGQHLATDPENQPVPGQQLADNAAA